jgi:hypothetical protein
VTANRSSTRRGRITHPMCLIISVANSEHFTFFAPLISRSKS